LHLLVAFGIGALIGLEREQSESAGTFAGSRTFPLFALYGARSSRSFPGGAPGRPRRPIVPLTVAYVAKVWYQRDIGLTTLLAALLTTVLGAVAMHSAAGATIAVVVGGAVTVLLSVKDPVHAFADRIDETERRASAKFILVVLVVLPCRSRTARWTSFSGSIPIRLAHGRLRHRPGLRRVPALGQFLGPEQSIALTGIVGGFVSSTATTVSMAEQSVANETLYHVCAFAVVVASIIMFPRALIEVAVVNPRPAGGVWRRRCW